MHARGCERAALAQPWHRAAGARQRGSTAGVRAMIDLSDGLASDARLIGRARRRQAARRAPRRSRWTQACATSRASSASRPGSSRRFRPFSTSCASVRPLGSAQACRPRWRRSANVQVGWMGEVRAGSAGVRRCGPTSGETRFGIEECQHRWECGRRGRVRRCFDRSRDSTSPGSSPAAPTGTVRVRRAYTSRRVSALNTGVRADSTTRVADVGDPAWTLVGHTTRWPVTV